MTIDLTPDQCRAAGLRLVSEPAGAVATEKTKAAEPDIPAEKRQTEAPASSNETKDDAQPPSAPTHGGATPLLATEAPAKETQEPAAAEGTEPSGTAPSSPEPQASSFYTPNRLAILHFLTSAIIS